MINFSIVTLASPPPTIHPPPTWGPVCQLLADPTIQCHPLGNFFVAHVGCIIFAGDVPHQSFEVLQNFKVLTTCNVAAHGMKMYHKHNMLAKVVYEYCVRT